MTQTAKAVSRATTGRRLVRRWLGLAAGCYLGVLLVMLLLENYLLYHPVSAEQNWEVPPLSNFQDVTLKSGDGTRIHAWWCPTRDWTTDQGALLYCHGNAGNLSHRADAIRALQNRVGQAVLIFDYPGYGKSEGKPSEAGCYAAGEAALDWLIDNQKIPPERILLYGKSLGGGVAVDLASRRPCRALFLVKTFTSLPDVAQTIFPWLPVRWVMRNRFDNRAKIERCGQPFFVLHGDADELVPLQQGREIFAAAGEPKAFHLFPGADHNTPLDPACFAAMRSFLDTKAPLPNAAAASSTGN